jgi:hypothetical protein
MGQPAPMRKREASRRRYLRAICRRRVLFLRRKARAHHRRFERFGQIGQLASTRKQWQKRGARRISRSVVTLLAPEVFGLLQPEARADLLHFIHDLKRLVFVAQRQVSIDFSETKKMYSDGTLLFAAELDQMLRATRIRQRRPKESRREHGRRRSHQIDCNYPRDNVVEQVLQHLGLLQMLNRKPRTQISAEDVKSWKMHTGTTVDGSLAEPLINLYRRLFEAKDSTSMYDGLVEAMTNSKHHAYLRPRRDGAGRDLSEPRWWMFAEQRNQKLSVSFCDLGIGINRSLIISDTWPRELVLSFLASVGGKTDSKFIKVAMELGRTRTKEENRGGGLHDLQEVIETVGVGHLLIFSNRGLYLYSGQGEQLCDFDDSIFGTLITWQIPVPR